MICVNFYNTLLVIMTENCGKFYNSFVEIWTVDCGEFYQGIKSKKIRRLNVLNFYKTLLLIVMVNFFNTPLECVMVNFCEFLQHTLSN